MGNRVRTSDIACIPHAAHQDKNPLPVLVRMIGKGDKE